MNNNRKSETLGKHPSSSNPDKFYTVKRITESDGTQWLGCDCPAFTRARCWKGVPSPERECKHTALHHLNDPATTTDDASPKPELVFGNVGEVTRQGDVILLPLIPLNPMGTDIMATAIYDTITEHHISWNAISQLYHVPHQWSWRKVKGYVEANGRTFYTPNKHPMQELVYYRMPVPIQMGRLVHQEEA